MLGRAHYCSPRSPQVVSAEISYTSYRKRDLSAWATDFRVPISTEKARGSLKEIFRIENGGCTPPSWISSPISSLGFSTSLTNVNQDAEQWAIRRSQVLSQIIRSSSVQNMVSNDKQTISKDFFPDTSSERQGNTIKGYIIPKARKHNEGIHYPKGKNTQQMGKKGENQGIHFHKSMNTQ